MFRYLLFTLIINISLVSVSLAERTFDIMSGTIKTSDSEVYAENVEGFIWVSVDSTTRNVSFEDDSYPAIRATFWSEETPSMGGAVELGFYSLSDKQSIDVDITSLSLQGLLRGNLMSSNTFPNGRLQPYVGMGLFFIMADVNINFQPEISSSFDVRGEDTAVGFMYGVRFQFTESVSMFLELRDISFNANFSEDNEWLNFSPDKVNMKLDSRFHLLGLSWKF